MNQKGIDKAIEEFQTLTEFKFNQYLIRVNEFFTINYPKINSWYKGQTDKPDSESFKSLYTLLNESSKALNTFSQVQNNINLKIYHFDFLELLESIKVKLLTTSNLSKFLRSTRTRKSFSSKIEVDYTTKRFDTLEKIQNSKINKNNFDDNWWELALYNDLSEDEYDSKGGEDLKIPVAFQQGAFLNSVVDNPIGDRIHGMDIKRKLNFVDDDLETLSFQDTVKQSLEIMLETKLGTIPERPQLGYNESLVVGSNRGVVSLPILQKQLVSIFNTDDSFTEFKINDIVIEQDSLSLEFEVNTVRGQTFNVNTTIG